MKRIVLSKVAFAACVFVTCGILSFSAVAATGIDRLNAFFTDIKSMRADFVQTVRSEGFSVIDRSEGVLQMLRPGRFRWDYQQPYVQKIIADGKKLWIYDVELEQIIVKPLNDALGSTPAALLSGTGSLTDRFEITELASTHNDGLLWVKLLPKEDNASFEQLSLAFDELGLRKMELIDAFGQITVLSFFNLQTNNKIAASVFDFTPPPGVDVLE